MHDDRRRLRPQVYRADRVARRRSTMKAVVFATLAVLMLSLVLPASALAGWHLMAPSCAPTHTVTLNDGSKTLEPVLCEPVDTGVGIRRLASLSKWKSFGSLDSVEACDNL